MAHRRRRYRHNPAGGTNWMPIVLIGGAAIFLLPRLMGTANIGGLFGTSILPAGYTYMGSGYYRGPDGQTYYRNPTTGQLAVSTPGAATAALATQAGYGLINTTVGAVAGGLSSLIRGLFTPTGGGAVTSQPPIDGGIVAPGTVASEVPVPDQPGAGYVPPTGGSDVGLTPTPLPDFSFGP